MLSGRFFIPMGPEHRVNMARTLPPVPFPAAPFRFSRKNLNGGKADGSHHPLQWTSCGREVTLEVYEFLDRADHKAENLSHEQRRHWDGREFDEYIVATEGVGIYDETPEDYLCRKETLDELMAVLDTCTEAQRRRFLLYALDGLTLEEIGMVCGCSKVSVYESIDAVRKKFLKFFANYPNE